MNILYKNIESLDVLEQLDDKTYDFIYLDIPYGRSPSHYFEYEFHRDSQAKSLVTYISKTRGVSSHEVTKEDVDQEKDRITQRGYKRYAHYVSDIMENVCRILKDNGILAFQAPMEDYTRINYKLVLDQIFPSIISVTVKMPRHMMPKDVTTNPDCLLYFCSKIQRFKFPVLMELPPRDHYKEQDDHGDYMLRPAFFKMRWKDQAYQYEWHGFLPPAGRQWRFTKEKMDEFFSDDRIVIHNNTVSVKEYRDEHLVPVSSVWDYDDKSKLHLYGYIDTKSIDRMFEMFANSDSSILCPYDRDGKFSWMADQAGYTWTSICPPGFPKGRELFSDIPEDHYIEITELGAHENRIYQGGIVTGVNDVNELKEMMTKVDEIQTLVGADSPEDAINEIQNLIDATVPESSVRYSMHEAQNWVQPYWDKLEPESKRFIPTGVALYNQFLEDPDADMAAAMIEYCKSLEQELFQKLFCEYIKDLHSRHINIESDFSESFDEGRNDKVFAEFLSECLGEKWNNPEEWKFEMGKMVYVLERSLADHPKGMLYQDFKEFLNRIFDQGFFNAHFRRQLDFITTLRNDCAHPHCMDQGKATEGRDLIRGKLMAVLEYYKEEN